MSVVLRNLEQMLGTDQESKLLHYCLGDVYLKQSRYESAEAHLHQSLEMDGSYSAAWKLLGETLAAAGKHDKAVAAFDQGIQVAEIKGDILAAKEMKVFRRRAQKTRSSEKTSGSNVH